MVPRFASALLEEPAEQAAAEVAKPPTNKSHAEPANGPAPEDVEEGEVVTRRELKVTSTMCPDILSICFPIVYFTPGGSLTEVRPGGEPSPGEKPPR